MKTKLSINEKSEWEVELFPETKTDELVVETISVGFGIKCECYRFGIGGKDEESKNGIIIKGNGK